MSQKLKISTLRPHPRNNEFFDDITGEAWAEFLQSIRTSGVIEPIVVTQNKVIVSGHQRVRACKVLCIDEIEAEVRIFDNEDEILKQLLETNIRQRGIGNTNAVKFGKCLMELERIYGIQNGNNQHKDRVTNNSEGSKTQADLASELGISVDTLNNYKRLAQAIPELQELVESGKVTKTTVLSIMKELPEDEQKQLARMISESDARVSGRELEFYKARVKLLNDKVAELESAEPEVREVEVVPADYGELKQSVATAKREANAYKADYRKEQELHGQSKRKIVELQDEIKELQMRSIAEQTHGDLLAGVYYFIAQCGNFIQDVGGYVWIADKLAEIPEKQREGYVKATNAVYSWAATLLQNIERDKEYGKPEIQRIIDQSITQGTDSQ